jgi:LacI family transcriptional regulator
MASGEQAVRGLAYLPLAERPTAIFAANDETALGVMMGLRQLGWQVPQDVSVCGFGDLPVAQAVNPTLTTVRIDLRELGRNGMLKVLAILKNETVQKIEIAPISIVERDSTASPGLSH